MTPLQAWEAGVSWVQGDSSLLPLGLPKDDITIDEKGITILTTILAGYNNGQWATILPVLYAPHPNIVSAQYRGCKIKQIDEIGDYCLVGLKYDQRYTNNPSTPLPNPQYGINGAMQEQDIQLHPNFIGGAGSWDANAPWSQFWDPSTNNWYVVGGQFRPDVPTYLYGVKKFVLGSATIWTKIFYEAQPLDPLPVGLIQDPGFGFGPSGHYLVTTCDQAKENAFWYQLTHYQYSSLPCDTHINNIAA